MRLRQQLDEIRSLLVALHERQTVKDWYSTDEFARIVGRSEWTVREWCRLSRVHGKKRGSGRGAHYSWAISHLELQRFQKEGLLPLARNGRNS